MTTHVLLATVIILLVIILIITLLNTKRPETGEINIQLIKLGSDLSKMLNDTAWMVATLDKLDPTLREEFRSNRQENQSAFKETREELNNSFRVLSTALAAQLEQSGRESGDKLKDIRDTVEKKLLIIQEENNKKLDEMRKIVDEKLQETVEKRFSESFRIISERLEQVHKGLGEMQSLASGVGDLKKVLTNVKTRGNLGEIQLGSILSQILAPGQYEQNVVTKQGSSERIEFAIKLPGRNTEDKHLLLPIDSKFPNEDYQRLLDAYENTINISSRELETINRQFENSIKKNAADIRDKYINPPLTTDFAIMFVPTEGLYAEILRKTGLFETLQRDYKITVVGPTNLVAFLSSLQMGFRTLAIEQRSSEVWEILGAVKTEFGHFGGILDKTKKKLQEATNVIDQAGIRSRAIERKLKNVQELPAVKTASLLEDLNEHDEDQPAEA